MLVVSNRNYIDLNKILFKAFYCFFRQKKNNISTSYLLSICLHFCFAGEKHTPGLSKCTVIRLGRQQDNN